MEALSNKVQFETLFMGNGITGGVCDELGRSLLKKLIIFMSSQF